MRPLPQCFLVWGQTGRAKGQWEGGIRTLDRTLNDKNMTPKIRMRCPDVLGAKGTPQAPEPKLQAKPNVHYSPAEAGFGCRFDVLKAKDSQDGHSRVPQDSAAAKISLSGEHGCVSQQLDLFNFAASC
jgi:hypothetical protein